MKFNPFISQDHLKNTTKFQRVILHIYRYQKKAFIDSGFLFTVSIVHSNIFSQTTL